MTARSTTEDVPHTAEQMYSLVADIERYPDFLPWCAAIRVVAAREEGGAKFLTADMVVSFRVFREQFRSLVRLEPSSHRIDAEYLDGPFRKLKNEWRFTDRAGGGSTVFFSIDFEFRNPLLQAAAHAAFEHVFLRMGHAFIERAHRVYGGGPATPAERVRSVV